MILGQRERQREAAGGLSNLQGLMGSASNGSLLQPENSKMAPVAFPLPHDIFDAPDLLKLYF